jgi:glycosyltransferase involved in cell wall biosynthesis
VGALDRAHYFKGLPVLLKAIASLKDWHLGIVGDGDCRRMYEQSVKRSPARDRIHFWGGLDREALRERYRAATVTVLPSTAMGEAFGLVLLESMACGTPVMASDLPGVRSVIPDILPWGLVARGNPDALARELNRVKSEPRPPELRTRLRGWVMARYTWDRVADLLERQYDRALSLGPSASL